MLIKWEGCGVSYTTAAFTVKKEKRRRVGEGGSAAQINVIHLPFVYVHYSIYTVTPVI